MSWDFTGGSVVKNPPGIREGMQIPSCQKTLRENGNSLQYPGR